MQIHHIRNATMILTFGEQHILVDPMLAPRGSLPSYRWLVKHRRKNPLVNMPGGISKQLKTVTCALVTHCQRGHVDHLDSFGINFLRERGLPVYCSMRDEAYLRKKGLHTIPLETGSEHPFLNVLTITPVPCRHGYGWITSLMENGVGYVIRYSVGPAVYIMGDTVLTPEARHAIEHYRPDWLILPAGGARLDVGRPLLMTLEEIAQTVEMAPGWVMLNHLEALDHCPVTRDELRQYLTKKGLMDRVVIPADGDILS